MKLCMFLPFVPDRRWTLARQAGVECAVFKHFIGALRHHTVQLVVNYRKYS